MRTKNWVRVCLPVRSSVVTMGSSAVPADTDRKVWQLQMAAIASRSVQDRLSEWEQLNRAALRMATEAIRRRHPDYDDRTVFLALVRRFYGDELALEVWPEAATVEP